MDKKNHRMSGLDGAGVGHGLPKEESIIYPTTKKVEQVDDYFGTQVADPYRWLETTSPPKRQSGSKRRTR